MSQVEDIPLLLSHFFEQRIHPAFNHLGGVVDNERWVEVSLQCKCSAKSLPSFGERRAVIHAHDIRASIRKRKPIAATLGKYNYRDFLSQRGHDLSHPNCGCLAELILRQNSTKAIENLNGIDSSADLQT